MSNCKPRLPSWFKIKLPTGMELEQFNKVKKLRKGLKLHTVCEEATCPNIHECWGRGTATFMIMGGICTRACRYCDVVSGKPNPLDMEEPRHVAEGVRQLGMKYVVITSVTRDDLPDGGAAHFAKTVELIKKLSCEVKIELLIPDFNGNSEDLRIIADSHPYVIGHNIEVVESAYNRVRPKGGYNLALEIIGKLKLLGVLTKSGIMVGLGESNDEVIKTMKDLRDAGCDILSIGQYLRPSEKHAPVQKFYTPDEFEAFRRIGLELGFKSCISGPLVRSSYMAEKAIINRSI